MTLPEVARIEIQGARVVVDAAPISLAAELFRANGAAARADATIRIVERFARHESGEPIDPDEQSADSALLIVRTALGEGEGGSGPDFTQRPASSAPGG